MSKPCFVYLIEAQTDIFGRDSLFKVGISDRPQGRLAQFATACPFPISLIGTWRYPSREEAFEIEQCFHKDYDVWRINGEWFVHILNGARCSLDDAALDFWVERRGMPLSTAPEFLRFVGVPDDMIDNVIGSNYGAEALVCL